MSSVEVPVASKCPHDHGFLTRMVDGIAGRQPDMAPTLSASCDLQSNESVRKMLEIGRPAAPRLRDTALATRRPPDFSADHAASEHAVILIAADKDSIRSRKPRESLRRPALHDLKLRHAKCCGVGGPPGPRGRCAPRCRSRAGWMPQQPLDRDRTRTKPDIPEQLTLQRLQRRQRHRTNFPLRQLAVMLEKIVVKAERDQGRE